MAVFISVLRDVCQLSREMPYSKGSGVSLNAWWEAGESFFILFFKLFSFFFHLKELVEISSNFRYNFAIRLPHNDRELTDTPWPRNQLMIKHHYLYSNLPRFYICLVSKSCLRLYSDICWFNLSLLILFLTTKAGNVSFYVLTVWLCASSQCVHYH